MAYAGWNAGGLAQWQGSPWQYPEGPYDAQSATSSKLPAIGSERRQSITTRPPRYSPTLHSHRPPSWQDEIGDPKSRSPVDFSTQPHPYDIESANAQHLQRRPPKPYDLGNLNGRGTKGRSSSTPAADAVKPNAFVNQSSRLRHLSMSGQRDAREAARSSIRLTRSPTEFVPSSMRNTSFNIPEEAVAGQNHPGFDDLLSRQLPNMSAMAAHQSRPQPSTQRNPRLAPRSNPQPVGDFGGRGPPQQDPRHFRNVSSNSSRSSEPEIIDPPTGLTRMKQEAPRETNIREFQEMKMPPPRPGSPNLDFDGSFADYADHMLTLRDALPPMEEMEPVDFPPELRAAYENPEARSEEIEHYLKLLETETPPDPDLARSLGIGAYQYKLMKMRDTVRRTIPNSTFPFFNGDKIDDQIQNYPMDVQMAFNNPPPTQKSHFVVVTFKHHRAEVFLHAQAQNFVDPLKLGEIVVVQADRGENVGQVWHICDTMIEAERFARDLNSEQLNNLLNYARIYVAQAQSLKPLQSTYKVQSQPGWVIRRAENHYLPDLQRKEHDETKAKRIAAQKADEMGFPLEILDTEFQIDHQKLTIYYISSEYVRFKELVNNIYKIYKMRIWMSSVNPQKEPEMFDF